MQLQFASCDVPSCVELLEDIPSGGRQPFPASSDVVIACITCSFGRSGAAMLMTCSVEQTGESPAERPNAGLGEEEMIFAREGPPCYAGKSL